MRDHHKALYRGLVGTSRALSLGRFIGSLGPSWPGEFDPGTQTENPKNVPKRPRSLAIGDLRFPY